MKVFCTALLSLSLTFGIINAQNDWCATDHYYQELIKANPGLKNQAEKEQDRLFANARNAAGSKMGNLITVPIVVHIIHDNGEGNISDKQVRDGIRIMNEDFQRLNPDTSVTRSIFKSIAGDAGIQFKLARIDPNGNCTNGIVRVNSPLTNEARNNVKSLSRWPFNRYFNVWLVNTIQSSGQGVTLGYAQFPFWGVNNTYGIVQRSDTWGTIETSNADGRTATHEAGHCFGLLHTFQSGCGGNCSFTGDEICDTPPVFEDSQGCIPTQNTCSNDASGPSAYGSNVVDQIENYMSYNSCQNMFTLDQIDVMQGVFLNFSELANLVSNSNLVATGTDTGYVDQDCAPVAEFIFPDEIICQSTSVTYTDISYNGSIGTRTWTFPGGSPATSSDSIVVVSYNTPGVYNATLTVSNAQGNDSKTHTDVIDVKSVQADFSSWFYTEGLENSAFDDNWDVIDNGGNRKWEITTDVAYTGGRSLYINNFSGNSLGDVDEFISPSYDLSAVVNPELYFKLAYTRRISGNDDALKVYYSIDCGQKWFIRYSRSGERLETALTQNSRFTPSSADDWTEVNITLPSSVKNSSNVLFRFEFTFDGGNNIYIDDINIQNPTGISELGNLSASMSVYPNPVSSSNNTQLIIDAKERLENVSVYLTDVRGTNVLQATNESNLAVGKHSINLSTGELSKGLYFVTVLTNQGRIVEKLIVN